MYAMTLSLVGVFGWERESEAAKKWDRPKRAAGFGEGSAATNWQFWRCLREVYIQNEDFSYNLLNCDSLIPTKNLNI